MFSEKIYLVSNNKLIQMECLVRNYFWQNNMLGKITCLLAKNMH